MICVKCPARKVCKDSSPQDLWESRNKIACCFGKEGRPFKEVCKECDVKELCKLCSGAGMDTIVITDELTRFVDFLADEDNEIMMKFIEEYTDGCIRIEGEMP